jgi:hypothetical protein
MPRQTPQTPDFNVQKLVDGCKAAMVDKEIRFHHLKKRKKRFWIMVLFKDNIYEFRTSCPLSCFASTNF